jgi:hypothetical protein
MWDVVLNVGARGLDGFIRQRKQTIVPSQICFCPGTQHHDIALCQPGGAERGGIASTTSPWIEGVEELRQLYGRLPAG